MCYDVSFQIDVPELADYFPDLIFDENIAMEFGAIDHVQGVGVFGKFPVIYINRDDGKFHCCLSEWGIIRFFEKEMPNIPTRNKYLNIRSERIFGDTTSYWYKIRNRRVLIPLTGTYDHRAVASWKKKVPYWIRPAGQQVFFLPGLYSVWEKKDPVTKEVLERHHTFGMITTKANGDMCNIHNDGENRYRMPLYLSFEMAMEFIDDGLTDERYKEILAFQIPSEGLEHHPVWTIRTGKLREDGKTKSDYWEWPNLPPLGEGNPDLPEEIEAA